MQTADSRAVAATRKAIVANGVPAHLTTYFGTNFAMRGPETPPPPGPEVVYPMAFLVEQSAGSTVQAHFHAANQFQVVVAGRGMLGRHEVAPICVHYTNAFNSYGPICAGGEGLNYFTLRKGYGGKTVLTGTGKLDLQVPRDRLASFDPQLIAKYQRCFPDFYDRIVSMYARGMSTREIQGHLRELYGIEVSPDLVGAVTDAVLDEVAEWQNRPLEAVYPLAGEHRTFAAASTVAGSATAGGPPSTSKQTR